MCRSMAFPTFDLAGEFDGLALLEADVLRFDGERRCALYWRHGGICLILSKQKNDSWKSVPYE